MQVNVSAAPAVFNFAPGLTLRVFDSEGNPWFPATDIEKMFDLSNIRKRVAGLDEDERATIKSETGGTLTIVNESGLWTLVLRSDAALKKDTVAYKARKWVTSEVLPAIRRTGRFECPAQPQYLTDSQCWQIQSAVGKRAHGVGVHFQTIYRALKARFKVPSYTRILSKDFDEAIRFIETCELRVPVSEPAALAATKAEPTIPDDDVVITRQEAQTFLNVVYVVKFLSRPQYKIFAQLLNAVRSPMTGAFWDAFNDMSISIMENCLARHGLRIEDMDCYKALTSR